jgi:hypothetical protein
MWFLDDPFDIKNTGNQWSRLGRVEVIEQLTETHNFFLWMLSTTPPRFRADLPVMLRDHAGTIQI